MTEENLRLKKKKATRRELSEAAFQLAVERGIDNFVVEDIVNKAGYSRRTFANYFSCKEEAIASSLTIEDYQRKDEDRELDGLSPLSTIELLIERSLTIEKLKRLKQLFSLSRSHPPLKLYVAGAIKEIQDDARKRTSENYGSEYPDAYYHLLIGAVFGAIMPILDGSIEVPLPAGESESEHNSEFSEYMKTVFSKLREGFQ
ncbi:TetR/AcrR family transcriptional regulator [Bacillus salacetis]|uniref:TetR/AcrR family transcriptional regulator n=1 Tax=Bacillus salacetis TaxID=2315464 RepID=A0A3A1QSY5_9BACI|nr:TetR/AcrR family transcriptional regulator [Bacillus salacetis]RIW30704.1 TetR/AcrR family transcriptional regulator [Bacillus salacetis]